jgi:hypothetical protein
MDPKKCPTAAQHTKVVLRIGPQEDKNDPSVNAKERSWLLWHADMSVPKCAGADCCTKPQHKEGLMSSSGPVDGHVDACATTSTEGIVCVHFKNLCSEVVCEVECKRLNTNEKTPRDMENDGCCAEWSDGKMEQSTL